MTEYYPRRRVARKAHQCFGCVSGNRLIRAGEVYLEQIEFPGGELGYADYARRPFRMRQCAECATRYGHTDLLQPATNEETS